MRTKDADARMVYVRVKRQAAEVRGSRFEVRGRTITDASVPKRKVRSKERDYITNCFKH